MLDDKKNIIKEIIKEIKELIYKMQNEFCEELDFDYDYNGRELTEDDLNMLEDCISNFSNKLELIIDEYEEWKNEY